MRSGRKAERTWPGLQIEKWDVAWTRSQESSWVPNYQSYKNRFSRYVSFSVCLIGLYVTTHCIFSITLYIQILHTYRRRKELNINMIKRPGFSNSSVVTRWCYVSKLPCYTYYIFDLIMVYLRANMYYIF